jgi:hypothetical protein
MEEVNCIWHEYVEIFLSSHYSLNKIEYQQYTKHYIVPCIISNLEMICSTQEGVHRFYRRDLSI